MSHTEYTPEHRRFIHINLAKLKKDGENFEVPVNVEEAIKFKEGKDVEVKDIINAPHIFFDAQKGELASEHHMQSVFGTSDPYEVAKVILKDGELQLTSEIRERERERKRKELIAKISRGAMDPKTKLPHPPERIRLALEEAKVKIDEFKTIDQQLEGIVDKLRVILPISFEKKMMSITIPGEFSGKAQNTVRGKGGLVGEDWGENGEWIVTVELPGGVAHELVEDLKGLTRGNVKIKDI